jgi:hypothetical protein
LLTDLTPGAAGSPESLHGAEVSSHGPLPMRVAFEIGPAGGVDKRV